MSNRLPRKAGFTLVELLTVAAIVGMLGALLLPSLGTAREKSRAAACVNNLRQVGQACLLYYDDNDVLPIAYGSGYLVWQSSDYCGYGETVKVAGRNLARCFFCPSATSFTANDPGTGLQNLGVTGQETAGSYSGRGLHDGAPASLYGPIVSLIADNYFAPGSARNHVNGVNVLRTDGSVRFVPLPMNWDISLSGAWLALDNWGP